MATERQQETIASKNVEREVKLSMKIGASLPDLRDVVGSSVRQPDEDLRAAYYDTPDLRLWERGITLRHRVGEGSPRWTLKLPRPASGDALVRTELEWIGDEGEIPAEARDAVCGIVRRASLQKVAELATERLGFLLEEDGVTWAQLTSDVVTVVGGRRDGLRFRQLELEILGDSDRAKETNAVVKALRRAGARPDPFPKVEKALGPRPRKPELGPKSSTEAVVSQAVSVGLNRLLDHDCRLRVAGDDMEPEDVHQARVATRRLRSDLGTLQVLLDPVWVSHMRGQLQPIGAALGAVRDVDVLTGNLRQAGADDRLIQMLDQERADAVEALLEVLDERSYLDLLDRLHAASSRPPTTDRRLARRKARRVLPRLVNHHWKKIRKEVSKGGRHPGDDRLHQMRKRSKQLRYASELAAPVTGKAAKKTAAAAESLQTLLGEYHDAVVASTWLKRAGNRVGAGSVSEVASLLSHEDLIKKQIAGEWRSCYKKLARREAGSG